MPALRLKLDREKALLRRHPWVFSGAVAKLQGAPASGETLRILSAKGEFLAWGAYSPSSQIRARVWSWDEREEIGSAFFQSRLSRALNFRDGLALSKETDAMRLVHGESDGLPGLVVDRYGDTLAVQITSSGAEFWREKITEALVELTGASRVFERSDVEVRRLEGLPKRTGLIFGSDLPERVQITERGAKFWVDIRNGHKTGFYLDQRQNRELVRDLAQNRDTLDCFAYSGGFAINALMGGATSVVGVDSSSEALMLGRENLALNKLPSHKAEWLEQDVFRALREFRDRGRNFDMIVLDPPKFAPTVSHKQRAARGYKDINLLAFKLLRPGGILITFSCSGGIDPGFFQKIVAGAALDAGVEAKISQYLHQGPDHPVALSFPEGAYLKGLVLRCVV